MGSGKRESPPQEGMEDPSGEKEERNQWPTPIGNRHGTLSL